MSRTGVTGARPPARRRHSSAESKAIKRTRPTAGWTSGVAGSGCADNWMGSLCRSNGVPHARESGGAQLCDAAFRRLGQIDHESHEHTLVPETRSTLQASGIRGTLLQPPVVSRALPFQRHALVRLWICPNRRDVRRRPCRPWICLGMPELVGLVRVDRDLRMRRKKACQKRRSTPSTPHEEDRLRTVVCFASASGRPSVRAATCDIHLVPSAASRCRRAFPLSNVLAMCRRSPADSTVPTTPCAEAIRRWSAYQIDDVLVGSQMLEDAAHSGAAIGDDDSLSLLEHALYGVAHEGRNMRKLSLERSLVFSDQSGRVYELVVDARRL